MEELAPVIAVGLFLLGLAALWPYLRAGKTKATIELLQSELNVERDARIAQERRCEAKIADANRIHAREIGELRGQLAVVTRDFAKTIAVEVVGALRDSGVIE